ncbi:MULTISPECIES: membrane lipoprotein lipid attachment site-containing protein [unclassified Paenibacillus]|uniref:membrane lipoprotein lipid attachment site-containing protein n=1 Tax=unclassified Paenibacillus TaxID=185978 RepID=UPI0008D7B0EC|nr:MULTISPECIES: membrane lipoprotein lipid attachment site-containing protein [unclassified Paenibacillus]QLG38134.1 membrane lipoprotein lipid attachment site-containing protein [Paenibacillus sp. E222]SEO64062.1 hypothetical protein SAMN05518670_4498 [Paenibacillus sp. OK076]
MKRIIFVIFLGLLVLSACSNNEKIDISSPSYMFSEDYKISKEIEVSLKGHFNKDDNNYEGSLSINEINFKKVLFKHNSLLISYEGSERTVLGDIYLNTSDNQFAIVITEPSLYKQLTNEEYNKDGLIISSPASSLEEARSIEENLKAME